jgi:predicted nucleotidyltransferase
VDDTIRQALVTDADRLRIERAALQVLGSRPWIQAAYLHGSAARGDRPARDIDIGLLCDPIPTDWDAEVRIAGELGAAAPIGSLEYDVRAINRADPVFLGNLLQGGRLLYEADREARIRFEVRALSLWLDYKPVWERLRTRVLEQWSRG